MLLPGDERWQTGSCAVPFLGPNLLFSRPWPLRCAREILRGLTSAQDDVGRERPGTSVDARGYLWFFEDADFGISAGGLSGGKFVLR
jgi:hypothetical protein